MCNRCRRIYKIIIVILVFIGLNSIVKNYQKLNSFYNTVKVNDENKTHEYLKITELEQGNDINFGSIENTVVHSVEEIRITQKTQFNFLNYNTSAFKTINQALELGTIFVKTSIGLNKSIIILNNQLII